MSTRLLLVSSEHHVIVQKDDRLYNRAHGRDEPIDPPPDLDLWLRAAVAKWGLYRVLNDAGELGVEIDGDGIPPLRSELLADGEMVYRVNPPALPPA